MGKEEILELWKKGITVIKLAQIHRRRYNQMIKTIKLNPKGRNAKFISNYESLRYVETIVYNYVMKNRCDL